MAKWWKELFISQNGISARNNYSFTPNWIKFIQNGVHYWMAQLHKQTQVKPPHYLQFHSFHYYHKYIIRYSCKHSKKWDFFPFYNAQNEMCKITPNKNIMRTLKICKIASTLELNVPTGTCVLFHIISHCINIVCSIKKIRMLTRHFPMFNLQFKYGTLKNNER